MEQLKCFHAYFTSCALIICSKNNNRRGRGGSFPIKKFFYPRETCEEEQSNRWKRRFGKLFRHSGITPSLSSTYPDDFIICRTKDLPESKSRRTKGERLLTKLVNRKFPEVVRTMKIKFLHTEFRYFCMRIRDRLNCPNDQSSTK